MPARFSNEFIREYVIELFRKSSFTDKEPVCYSLHTGEKPTTFLSIDYDGRDHYAVKLFNRTGILRYLMSTYGIDSSRRLLETTLISIDGVVDSFYDDIESMQSLGFVLLSDDDDSIKLLSGESIFKTDEGSTMYRRILNGDVMYVLTDYDRNVEKVFVEVGIKPANIREWTHTYEHDRVRYDGELPRVEAVRRFISFDWPMYIAVDRAAIIDKGMLLTSIPLEMRDALIRHE